MSEVKDAAYEAYHRAKREALEELLEWTKTREEECLEESKDCENISYIYRRDAFVQCKIFQEVGGKIKELLR